MTRVSWFSLVAIALSLILPPAAHSQALHDVTNGADIIVTITNSVPASTCATNSSSTFFNACGWAAASGSNSSTSANAVSGGAINITINSGVTLGQNDATTSYTGYAAGVVGVSVGGVSPIYPGQPGSGGGVTITNNGIITINTGSAGSLTNPRTAIETTRQLGVPEQIFYFGGGILADSTGGPGPSSGVNASNSASRVSGAAGGDITITNNGEIVTGAYKSGGGLTDTTNAGILALSIGGDAAAAEQQGTYVVFGQGANGGAITITNTGTISTAASVSPGIIALSQGGGGSVSSSSIAGGTGGAVTVNAPSGSITTSGDQSSGIVAISAGGGIIGSEQQGISGTAGNVSVTIGTQGASNQATITTSGVFAPAVIAASVAGGLETSQSQIRDFTTSGGSAGTVSITNYGTVTATGNGSDGLVAQSIGAGGGVVQVPSSYSSTSYTIGATASVPSTSNNVTVMNDGSVTTGVASDSTGAAPANGTTPANQEGIGIIAQSVAGGGGIAYILNSDVNTTLGSTAASASGAGGTAGTVNVTNTGTVTTYQNAGDGILAQSVGGGGGDGKGKGFIIRYGSAGGPGGDGGPVTITNDGALYTYGWEATGIIAQSIGGGGGTGGSVHGFAAGVGGTGGAGGTGGQVTVTNGGNLTVTGDDSYGILAQSIGGGGGNGGKASAFGGIAVAIGGSGASGGVGGTVTVNDSGNLTTGSETTLTGSQSVGILAQSIGGGGGTGGNAHTQSAGLLTISTSVGGQGGPGSPGGDVTINIGSASGGGGGSVTTFGVDAYGAAAQSIGGGGGSGGQSSARSLALFGSGDIPSISISSAVGGSGSAGGAGNAAAINLYGSVSTFGTGAVGLVAQSIGGGGGIGGDSSATATTALASPDNTSVSVTSSVGGSGGSGGAGGTVNVNVYASPAAATTIGTSGDHAHGILAQSIGGGGGIGGVGDGSATTASLATGVGVAVAVGGSGGTGGNGGAVTVNSASGISTSGSGADGILAQSIGGGGGTADGGTAGMASASAQSTANWSFNLQVGGSGGNGGSGGGVTVSNGAAIRTAGGASVGILAQSIGGGGGEGGSADPDAGSGGSNPLYFVGSLYGPASALYQAAKEGSAPDTSAFLSYGSSVSVGGKGGSGGDGGTVSVSNAATNSAGGSILTTGNLAHGIVAQSIGGGGGAGGSATSQALSGGHISFASSFDLALGGSGGTAGSGGSVTVTNGVNEPTNTPTYFIQTAGTQAMGIVAQSIGGGGGTGASGGIIGGGTLDLGGGRSGSGGSSGNGGAVTVDNYGLISTTGSDSVGILAQSVGAGGGFGGSATNAPGAATTKALTVSLGGGAGSSGAGGTVTINDSNGSITTTGARAIGVLAQSIGGGGGMAGTGSATVYDYNFSIGSGGKTSGNGGQVSATFGTTGNPITIQTQGAGAHAIVAQSIGGGGGLAGDSTIAAAASLPTSAQNSAQASGTGGPVTVTVNNGVDLTTSGANADAIIAQSVGGGGGIVNGALGTAGGTGYGGAVTVNISGSPVSASGANAYGIFAQSIGQGGLASASNGAITITLTNGASITGGNGGAAVFVSGGNTANALTIDSTSSVCGFGCSPSQIAIQADTVSKASLGITNNGSITGTVMTSAGTTFNNYGTFTTSGTSNIYSLVNYSGGVIDIGGPSIATATFNGGSNVGLGLEPGSQVKFNTNFFTGATDVLHVNGILYLQGGTLTIVPVQIVPQTVAGIVTATQLQTFLTPPSATTIAATPNDLVYSYTISSTGSAPISFNVTPNANFKPAGVALNANQTQAASALQTDWNTYKPGAANDAQLAQVFTSVSGQTASTYPGTLSALYSEYAGGQAASSVSNGQSAATATQSCPEFDGPDTLLREHDCMWFRVTGQWTHSNTTSDNAGSTGSAVAYQIGGQKEIAEGWFLGGTALTELNWNRSNSGHESGNGSGQDAAVTLKRQIGPWLFSGVIAGGYNDSNTTRVISLPGVSAITHGSPSSDYVLGRARASYEFVQERWYAKPTLDLDLIRVHTGGYTENGSGAFDLSVDSSSQVLFAATPSVEIGARFTPTDTMSVRPYVTLGVTTLSNDTWTTTERILGGAMQVKTKLPPVVGVTAINLDLVDRNGLEVRLQYGANITGQSLSQTGFMRVGYRF